MRGQGLKNRTVDDYLPMLQAFLPRGLAWTRAPGAALTRSLYAFAEELARLDGEIHRLFDEVDPSTAYDGLEDWERMLGLPDECLPLTEGIDDRRFAVMHKLTDTGRQDLAYWYSVAAALGHDDVVIEEHTPFICGYHECAAASLFTPEQEQAANFGRCGPEEIRYWWNVIVRGPWFTLFRTGSASRPPDNLQDLTGAAACARLFRCGASAPPDLLGVYVCAVHLECVMQREKLAHTYLTFTYEEKGNEISRPLRLIQSGGRVHQCHAGPERFPGARRGR